MIELSHVTVRFEDRTVLDHVNHTVESGEWLGIIGPNGAGKSTLLRAISGLQPADGEIRIDDRPLRALSQRQLASLVAYVPQQPSAPGDMTVADYVLLGRTASIGWFGTETRHDRRVAAGALDRLGLGGFASRVLGTLSGGELQRVVLARALAQEAPILVLDEPTSALDIGRQQLVLDLVHELREDRRLTVIAAMHDLTLAGEYADRLLLLHGGVAVMTGTAAEVLTEPVLRAAFGADVRVVIDEAGSVLVVPGRVRGRTGTPVTLS